MGAWFRLSLLVWMLGGASSAWADLSGQIDGLIQKEVTSSGFQGNVLVRGPQGDIFSRSYGSADLEFGVPNSRATKFRIGSITKQFTAAAVLALYAAGKIGDLNDPVSKYLAVPASWGPVTLHQLLTHTAGLDHDPPLLKAEYGLYHSLEQLFQSTASMPFSSAPGSHYAYSNAGYSTLAYLVQQVSGMDYADYLKAAVLRPSGLSDTGDDSELLIVPLRARGYWKIGGELLNAAGLDLSNVDGAGSVYSTVGDLIKWDLALHGDSVLPRSVRELLFRPYAAIPGSPAHYGYGWVIDQWRGHTLIWHNGEVNGYTSDFARFVDDQVTIVTLSNRYGLGDSLARIRESIASLVFDSGVK